MAADTINIGWFTLPVPIPDYAKRLGWHPLPESVGPDRYARVGWYKLSEAFFGPPGPPVIRSPSTANGTVGVPFNFQITASGRPTSFNAVGLPAGLTLDTTNGRITGTPTSQGTSSVTVEATNEHGTGTATLTLNVAAAPVAAPAAHYGSTMHWMMAPPPVPAQLTPAYLKGLASTVANPASGSVMACSVPAGTHGFIFAYPDSLPAASQIMQQGLGMNVLPGTMQVTVDIDGVDYRVYYMEDQEFPHPVAETYTLTIG